MERSIEIIGGGLAGLSLGLALVKARIKVSVIEAGNYPRHRVCGEFIAGLSERTTHRLGLAPLLSDAAVHREMAWFDTQGRSRVRRLPSPALGLSRYALDARLADAFIKAGGNLILNTRAGGDRSSPGKVWATGRQPQPSSWLGLKIHLRDLDLERGLEMHMGDDAYVGLSLVEDGAVNLCGLFRRRKLNGPDWSLITAYLAACKLNGLLDRLKASQVERSSFVAVAGIEFHRHIAKGSAITVGDSCAVIPPFTGNGMAMAFQSAELAIEPLVAYAREGATWAETCRTIQQRQRRCFRLRLEAANLIHPFLFKLGKQRLFTALDRTHLLPFNLLYASLH